MPPGLQAASSIFVIDTTGRHGSRFQLVLPGSAASATSQWHTNWSRMPGRSASGASASTSDHASSGLTNSVLASLPAGVGYTRRLDRSAQCTHWVWSTYGGGGASAWAGAAMAMLHGSAAIAAPARTAMRMPLARLPLNLEEFRTHVDEVHARGTGRDDQPHDAQYEGEQRRCPENDQPHGLGQFVGGGVGVAALEGGVDERVHPQCEDSPRQKEKDGTRKAGGVHFSSLGGHRPYRRMGYFWVTFLAPFLAGAFLAVTFFAAFFAGAAFLEAFFAGSRPISLAARSPTARVWLATLPSASWVSSTVSLNRFSACARRSSNPGCVRSRSRAASPRSISSLYSSVTWSR